MFYGDCAPLDFNCKYNDEKDGLVDVRGKMIELCEAAAAERRAAFAGPHVRAVGRTDPLPSLTA